MNANARKNFFQQLNWRLPDALLSKETGLHRLTIHAWRKRLKKKPVMNQLKVRGLQSVRSAKHWRWSAGVAAVAKQHGISRTWAYVLRERVKNSNRKNKA